MLIGLDLKMIDNLLLPGYCIFLGSHLISKQSWNQNVVARPNVEVEYRAMANIVCELLWLKQFLHELGFPLSRAMICFVIIKQLPTLYRIPSSMNEQNTLRSIVISFDIMFLLISSSHHISSPRINQLTCLLKQFLVLNLMPS